MGVAVFANGQGISNVETVVYYRDVGTLVCNGRRVASELNVGAFICGYDFYCKDLETTGIVLLESESGCEYVQSDVAYVPRINKCTTYNCTFASSTHHNEMVSTIRKLSCSSNMVSLSGCFAKVAIAEAYNKAFIGSSVCVIRNGSVQSIHSRLACCLGTVSSLASGTCYVKEQRYVHCSL